MTPTLVLAIFASQCNPYCHDTPCDQLNGDPPYECGACPNTAACSPNSFKKTHNTRSTSRRKRQGPNHPHTTHNFGEQHPQDDRDRRRRAHDPEDRTRSHNHDYGHNGGHDQAKKLREGVKKIEDELRRVNEDIEKSRREYEEITDREQLLYSELEQVRRRREMHQERTFSLLEDVRHLKQAYMDAFSKYADELFENRRKDSSSGRHWSSGFNAHRQQQQFEHRSTSTFTHNDDHSQNHPESRSRGSHGSRHSGGQQNYRQQYDTRKRNKLKMDYYDILGVSKFASQTDIKQGFLEKARECHPDKVSYYEGKASTDEFILLRKAFDVLMDPNLRQAYDIGEDIDDPRVIQKYKKRR